eukprot:TRINITY_DN5448_c0_g1_i1.p1 TRINITY_DN5448_c0_g1~~TRINITY_DN5448_c0_g1_i1.p1  ORF type:complete len:889 (+),score=120.37 TRINITY_DN5448_c0_g1_i1:42-2669(+)
MGLLGIQTLTLALAISMIFATGMILGGISITTGNKSTDDARATGDKSFAQCMDSGAVNIKAITGELLLSVLTDFKGKLLTAVTVPGDLIEWLGRFGDLIHPDTLGDPVFLDTFVRSVLFSRAKLSMESFGDITLSIRVMNVTTNSDTLSQKYRGNWGGVISYFSTRAADGRRYFGVMESRYPGGPLNEQNLAIFGNADESGNIVFGRCNYTNPAKYGVCPVFIDMLWAGMRDVMSNRCYFNMRYANPAIPLDPPKKVIFSPIAPGPYAGIHTCRSITHAAQKNIYPRQDNRVGLAASSINTRQLSEDMRAASLPEGSLLFAIEKSPWTGVVSTIAGANIGFSAEMFRRFNPDTGAEELPLYLPFAGVNHTTSRFVGGEHSPIARHSRYMIAMANGSVFGEYYEYVENLPSDQILDWTDTKTSTLYWMRVASIKYLDALHWYIVFLVPRNSVMSVIDQAERSIRLQVDADKKKADDDRKQMHIIMYCVTAGAVIVLLALSIVFTNIIISPLRSLIDDMAAVAVMETECVDLTSQLSSLSEVKAMQKSFRAMVNNLIEYKNYMPQSVLYNESEPEEEEEESAENNTIVKTVSESKSSDKKSLASTRSRSVRSSLHREIQHKTATEMGLKNRGVTIVMFNSLGWHEVKDQGHSEMGRHAKLIDALLKAVEANKGTSDAFSGDRMMAYFNAIRNNSEHRACGARAGLQAQSFNTTQAVITFGSASGEARVGNIGIVGMKKFSILSTVVPLAAALERYATTHKLKGVIDPIVREHSQVCIEGRALDLVTFPKRFKKPQLIFEALELREVKEEEWMYQLETTSKNDVWNKFVLAMKTNDFKEAAEHRDALMEQKIVSDDEHYFKLWLGRLQSNSVEPVPLY